MIAATTADIAESDRLRARTVSSADSSRTLLESDSARPIVETMARLIPASSWYFARPAPVGDAMVLLSSEAEHGIAGLARTELQRQRATVRSGPRISATLAFYPDYESGITLMLADANMEFGIFTLLRTLKLGPFTSTEIRVMTLALDAACARFSSLPLHPRPRTPETPSGAGQRSQKYVSPTAEFFVLDQDYAIVLEQTADGQSFGVRAEPHERHSERFPPVLEETLRGLLAGRPDGSSNEAVVGGPLPFLSMRTQPMAGPGGSFIGVRIAGLEPEKSFTGAADRFNISPREVQVLALLLDGRRLAEVATRLHITASTVQDHITKMLYKTESRNRSQLIAKVLGWRTTPMHGSP